MLHFAGSCGSRLACLCVACLSEYLPAALRRRHGARSQARRQAGLGRGCPEPSIEDGELNRFRDACFQPQCAGESFASRMAGSLLKAVGLPELITHSLEEYEAVALTNKANKGDATLL